MTMKTDQNTPAASSLPPSDGGGSPNIPQGTQRAYWCRVRNAGASGECNRLLIYCNAYIMPLSDHCDDAPENAIPHGDDGDYVWTGWVEEACEQCETYWSFSGTVIRWMELPQDWSAPTQQPAEHPEAGGDSKMVAWLENMVRVYSKLDAVPIEADREKFRNYVSAYSSALTAAKRFAATPRPESPDAQTTVADWKAKWDAVCAEQKSVPPEIVRAINENLFDLLGEDALPAKGPGPRNDKLEASLPIYDRNNLPMGVGDRFIYQPGTAYEQIVNIELKNGVEWLTFFNGVGDGPLADFWYAGTDQSSSLKIPKTDELAPPPASHSKQREQQT